MVWEEWNTFHLCTSVCCLMIHGEVHTLFFAWLIPPRTVLHLSIIFPSFVTFILGHFYMVFSFTHAHTCTVPKAIYLRLSVGLSVCLTVYKYILIRTLIHSQYLYIFSALHSSVRFFLRIKLGHRFEYSWLNSMTTPRYSCQDLC